MWRRGQFWATLSSEAGLETLCPAAPLELLRFGDDGYRQTRSQFYAVNGGPCGIAGSNLGTKGAAYCAAAVFACNCALAGRSRGTAAISFCVYSCCGLAKICSVEPHSTISP